MNRTTNFCTLVAARALVAATPAMLLLVAATPAMLLLVAATPAMLLLVAATPAMAQPGPEASKTAPDVAKPASGDKKVSDMDKIGNTAENIVEKPFRDLNLVKDKIPPDLQAITKAPYSLKGLRTCSQYGAEVRKLTRLLGPDVDSGVAAKKGQNAGEFALSLGESAAGSLIPGAGIIRKISGADAAQKRALAAVLAGQLRRAYIKGTARAKGCKI